MDTWQQVLSAIEKKVNRQSFDTWFKPTQLIRHEGSALYVRVPNAYFQDWLNEHLQGPWLTGSALTHADVATVCCYDFIAAANPGLFDTLECQGLETLDHRANEMPAFQATRPAA